MNLGQVIGALMMASGSTPAEALARTRAVQPPEPVAYVPPKRKLSARVGGNTWKIRQVLREAYEADTEAQPEVRGFLRVPEIVSRTGINRHQCAALVVQMPDLDRIGERGKYRYRVKVA